MTAPAAATSHDSVKGNGPIARAIEDGTEYVILSRIDDGDWTELTGRVKARGNEAAIRSYLDATKEKPNDTVEYVAIPTRSWTPLRVRVQTVTTLKLEEAK